VSSDDVTTGELWRQGLEIKSSVDKLDSKLDNVHDMVTRHDEHIVRHTADIAEMRADLKSKRLTTSAIAGVVATVITIVGEILGHIH
jgi:hypothetical protein